MTAPRSGRIALVGAVVVALASVLVLVAPSAAQDAGDPPPFEGTGAVGLVQQTTWIDPDGDVSLQLDVSAAPADATLEVTFHDRLAGRYQLEPSFSGGSLGRRLRTISSGTVTEADPDGDGRVTVRLGLRSGGGDPARLLVTRAGLHPVQVTVRSAAGEPIGGFVTHVVRVPDEVVQPLGLAVVQAIDAAPSHQADGSIQVSSQTRADLTATTAALLPALDVPITYRITPEALEALAASAEELDAALLGELRTLAETGSIAVSPYVRLDVDALAAAGMQPTIEAQLQLGTATLESILATTVARGTWIADATLAADGLTALADLGIERLVVPNGSLVGPTAEHPMQPVDVGQPGDGVRLPALTTDLQLQSHVGSTGSSVLDAQHLLADLAAIWLDRPSIPRATVLELPSGQPDRTFVRTTLAGIAGSPLVATGTVDEVVQATDAALRGGAASVDGEDEDGSTVERMLFGLAERDVPDLSDHRSQVRRTREHSATAAGVFRDSSDGATDPVRIAVSSSADLTPRERSNHLSAITDRIDADLEAIDMPEQATVTLPSRDGVIPITLVNNSGKAATVAIELDSDKLELPDGGRVQVRLDEVLNPIEIPVKVRSSGAFPLEMSLETPDGRVQLVASTYTIRSTAVSGLGIALSVAAVAVLAVWWFRTARRARQAHREAATSEGAGSAL